MFIKMKEIIESTHRVLLLHFSSWLSGMKYWERKLNSTLCISMSKSEKF